MTENEMTEYQFVCVRTEYDGKDLISVSQIYTEDGEGNEVVLQGATEACIGIVTCADQGDDLWSSLREQVAFRLQRLVKYEDLYFDDQP